MHENLSGKSVNPITKKRERKEDLRTIGIDPIFEDEINENKLRKEHGLPMRAGHH